MTCEHDDICVTFNCNDSFKDKQILKLTNDINVLYNQLNESKQNIIEQQGVITKLLTQLEQKDRNSKHIKYFKR